ncbi:TIGR02611 family protein [Sphaerisporangium sp. NPDC005288]|uniref:TIGR02611 family protein n=1 Tax=Sphaerisporangium sp. NPDC005288 TaxID=3155114 RepID=UPI0033A65A13
MTDDRRGDATKNARREGFKGRLDDVRSTRTGRLTLKIVVGVVGAALVIGGLLLVPLPGPGWLIVFAGLAVLATEFEWAHRLLQFAKRTLESWTDWLKRQNWPVRILVGAVTLATAAVIVWAMLKLSLGIDLIQQARQFVT